MALLALDTCSLKVASKGRFPGGSMASLCAEYSIMDLDLRTFEEPELFAGLGTEMSSILLVLYDAGAGILTQAGRLGW